MIVVGASTTIRARRGELGKRRGALALVRLWVMRCSSGSASWRRWRRCWRWRGARRRGRGGDRQDRAREAACQRAEGLGHEVLRARGSELEAGSRSASCASCSSGASQRRASEREALLAGPAGGRAAPAAGEIVDEVGVDSSFAVLHGLYWLPPTCAERPIAARGG